MPGVRKQINSNEIKKAHRGRTHQEPVLSMVQRRKGNEAGGHRKMQIKAPAVSDYPRAWQRTRVRRRCRIILTYFSCIGKN